MGVIKDERIKHQRVIYIEPKNLEGDMGLDEVVDSLRAEGVDVRYLQDEANFEVLEGDVSPKDACTRTKILLKEINGHQRALKYAVGKKKEWQRVMEQIGGEIEQEGIDIEIKDHIELNEDFVPKGDYTKFLGYNGSGKSFCMILETKGDIWESLDHSINEMGKKTSKDLEGIEARVVFIAFHTQLEQHKDKKPLLGYELVFKYGEDKKPQVDIYEVTIDELEPEEGSPVVNRERSVTETRSLNPSTEQTEILNTYTKASMVFARYLRSKLHELEGLGRSLRNRTRDAWTAYNSEPETERDRIFQTDEAVHYKQWT